MAKKKKKEKEKHKSKTCIYEFILNLIYRKCHNTGCMLALSWSTSACIQRPCLFIAMTQN